jgi:hypothetical protein
MLEAGELMAALSRNSRVLGRAQFDVRKGPTSGQFSEPDESQLRANSGHSEALSCGRLSVIKGVDTYRGHLLVDKAPDGHASQSGRPRSRREPWD